MKIISLFLITFLSFFKVQAQKDTVINFAEIVKVSGATKSQLYQRARDWFNTSFKSSKDVLQIQDKESGELAGKAILESTLKSSPNAENSFPVVYKFSVNIYVKDGRYKFEFTDFISDDDYKENIKVGIIKSGVRASTGLTDVAYASAKENLAIKVKGLITTLKSAMSKPGKTDF